MSAAESRSVAVAGRPFTTEASRWSRGLLQAEQTVCEALEALGEVSPVLAEPGLCHDSALRFGSTGRRASRRLVAAWVAAAEAAGDEHSLYVAGDSIQLAQCVQNIRGDHGWSRQSHEQPVV